MKKSTTNQPKKVVIVGAGFAGISLARQLARTEQYDITLVSETENFKYYPLLYSTATGHTHIKASFPISFLLFDKPEVGFVRDKITNVDTKKHLMTGQSGTQYPYDIAVMATGMVTNYFNIPGLAELSLGTKTVEQALELRQQVHSEMLAHGTKGYTCVVVGGGATGVELSAAMTSYLRRIALLHDLPEDKFKVYLVESGPRVLRYLPEEGSAKVAHRLERLGVTIMTSKAVESQTADAVVVSGETIPADTVVWTAGVTNNPLLGQAETTYKLAKNKLVETDQYLMGAPDVYVLGDNAAMPHSGLAETAVSHGKYLAKQLKRLAAGQQAVPYHPHNPISVVPVGEGWAVASYRKFVLTGWPASLLRRAADLIGYIDVASIPVALTLWLADHKIENECPLCRRRRH